MNIFVTRIAVITTENNKDFLLEKHAVLGIKLPGFPRRLIAKYTFLLLIKERFNNAA